MSGSRDQVPQTAAMPAATVMARQKSATRTASGREVGRGSWASRSAAMDAEIRPARRSVQVDAESGVWGVSSNVKGLWRGSDSRIEYGERSIMTGVYTGN